MHKLDKHMETDPDKYSCNSCAYKTHKKANLKEHEQCHDLTRYPCNICDFQATRKKTLKGHIQSIHERKKFSCSQCNKKTERKNDLRHMKTCCDMKEFN